MHMTLFSLYYSTLLLLPLLLLLLPLPYNVLTHSAITACWISKIFGLMHSVMSSLIMHNPKMHKNKTLYTKNPRFLHPPPLKSNRRHFCSMESDLLLASHYTAFITQCFSVIAHNKRVAIKANHQIASMLLHATHGQVMMKCSRLPVAPYSISLLSAFVWVVLCLVQ